MFEAVLTTIDKGKVIKKVVVEGITSNMVTPDRMQRLTLTKIANRVFGSPYNSGYLLRHEADWIFPWYAVLPSTGDTITIE